jgi:hypothetical protein
MQGGPEKEITPPWVMFPEVPPGDFFWREAGEPWLTEVWEPYWRSLSAVNQEEYLVRWKVPDNWRTFYFDKKFRDWLESVDDEN